MLRICVRPWGVRAVVCLLVGLLLSCWQRPARAETVASTRLLETAQEPGVVVYPARASGVRPVVVLLHGMCGEPERTCAHFAELVTRDAHLICPRARQRCAGGAGSTWSKGAGRDVEAAVQRGLTTLPASRVNGERRTLIGYSLGAFVALEIAEAAHGVYPEVMLIGARIFPNARLLQQNGVERLLLAAGDWDMTSAHMQQQSKRLARAGVEARFLGLGPVGHAFTPTLPSYVSVALSWLRGERNLS
ncbi:MAG: alpha/beta fold hydrolase [Polyangiaceae bacterium]